MANNPRHTENLTSFQKGNNANPSGRPIGSKNRKTIMRKVLEMEGILPDEMYEALKATFPGIEKTMTFEEMATIAQVASAVKGDTAAYKAVMDSAYGLPKAEIEHSGTILQGTIIIWGDGKEIRI